MNEPFRHAELSPTPDTQAPDGSDVRLLVDLPPSAQHGGGGIAHFELGVGETSTAVTHRTVEELWYFVSGRGEMWRAQDGREQVLEVRKGMALTIPLGTHFQFRTSGAEPLAAVGTTLPRWPGTDDEAIVVEGPWQPTVPSV